MNPYTPANQEHFEAHQEQVNKDRIESLSKLDPEIKELIMEVEKISQKLADKHVPHYILVDNNKDKEKYHFYRYNYLFKVKHDDYFTKEAITEGLCCIRNILQCTVNWIVSARLAEVSYHFFDKMNEMAYKFESHEFKEVDEWSKKRKL